MAGGDLVWAELLSIANILFGLILCYFSIQHARHLVGFHKALRYILALVGLYWAGFYAFVLFTPAGAYDPVAVPRVFVRPMLTLTLGIIAAHAVYRARITKPE